MLAVLIAILTLLVRLVRRALVVLYGVASAFVAICGPISFAWRRWLIVARGCIPPPRAIVVGLLVVAAIFGIAAPPAQADITTGLALWCPLNETSGTAIVDATGQHPSGTFVGTISTVASPFPGRTAIDFNGTSHEITFADANDLEFTRSFSVAFWIKTNTASMLAIAAKPNAAFTTGYEIYTNAGSGQFTTRPVGMNYVVTSPDFNTNNWEHVAFTLTDDTGGNATLHFYLNGVLQATSSSTAVTVTSNTEILRIGSRRGALFFAGALSDFRIYQRTLSAADVKELYGWTPEFPKFVIAALDQRLNRKQAHFDTYGTYAIAP